MKFITNLWQIFTNFYPLTSYKFWLNCFSSIKLLKPTLLAIETMEKMVIIYSSRENHSKKMKWKFSIDDTTAHSRRTRSIWHLDAYEDQTFAG